METYDLLSWAEVETVRNLNKSLVHKHISQYLALQFDDDWMAADASYRYDLTNAQRATTKAVDRG